MDIVAQSRALFLRNLFAGGGALAVLSACGSRGSLVPSGSPILSKTLSLDEALFSLDAYAVLMGANYYVRSDMRNVGLKPPPIKQGKKTNCTGVPAIAGGMHTMDCGTGGFGAIMDLPTIADITVYGQGTATLSGGVYDFYLSFGGTFTPFGGAPYNGPIYQTKPPALTCAQTALGTVGDQLRSIAEGIVAGVAVTCIQQGCQGILLNAARGVLAGTVSLAAFADVLIAVVAAVDLPALLAACGVAVSIDLIYQYIKCLAGGG